MASNLADKNTLCTALFTVSPVTEIGKQDSSDLRVFHSPTPLSFLNHKDGKLLENILWTENMHLIHELEILIHELEICRWLK